MALSPTADAAAAAAASSYWGCPYLPTAIPMQRSTDKSLRKPLITLDACWHDVSDMALRNAPSV